MSSSKIQLHLLLVSKRKSGAGGKHKSIKDKSKIKKLLKQLLKKGYYE